jgi:hypothetical protein
MNAAASADGGSVGRSIFYRSWSIGAVGPGRFEVQPS